MTEIITTINTKTITAKLLQQMLKAGSTIFRINMSHAEIAAANSIVPQIRKIATDIAKPVKIMIDLPGPEIRLSNLPHSQQLQANSTFKFYFQPHAQCPYFSTSIHQEAVMKGDKFYLQDGDFRGFIEEISGDYATLTVENNNILRDNCHFSIPGKSLHLKFLSPADKEIINQTANLNPDFFALSFVSSATDVQEFIDFQLTLNLKHKPNILTKFENAKSLLNIDEIIAISDYLYIARGDLGSEVSIPALPSLQKYIGNKCQLHNKPFFVATQMMDSMINHPSPTRAEISDVANAIFEGAAGVTLSDETTIGKYPIATIQWMKRVITANFGSIEENLKDFIDISL